jgi:hypothetical protein
MNQMCTATAAVISTGTTTTTGAILGTAASSFLSSAVFLSNTLLSHVNKPKVFVTIKHFHHHST